MKKIEKKFTMPKTTDKGILWDFSICILSQNSEATERGPFEHNFFRKKCPTRPKKTERWCPLVSHGILRYAEKRENLSDSVRRATFVEHA